MGYLRSDQGNLFTSSRWTLSSWIPVGGLPCTWPPPWGTSSVPACSWHTAQMWAGRIAAAGQVGTPTHPYPTAWVSRHHILTSDWLKGAQGRVLPCDVASCPHPAPSASGSCEYPGPGAGAAGAAVPGLPAGGEAAGRHPCAPGEAAQGEVQLLSLPTTVFEHYLYRRLSHSPLHPPGPGLLRGDEMGVH